jgi:hypothetical protein
MPKEKTNYRPDQVWHSLLLPGRVDLAGSLPRECRSEYKLPAITCIWSIKKEVVPNSIRESDNIRQIVFGPSIRVPMSEKEEKNHV